MQDFCSPLPSFLYLVQIFAKAMLNYKLHATHKVKYFLSYLSFVLGELKGFFWPFQHLDVLKNYEYQSSCIFHKTEKSLAIDYFSFACARLTKYETLNNA